MAKRKTVCIDVPQVLSCSKTNGWSAATLARKVGKHERWLSEVKRGRNLPSPEEAARMCAILQVEPEEILIEKDDVDLVRSLIDSQREEQQKNKPAPDGDELTGGGIIKEWMDELSDIDEAESRVLLEMIRAYKKGNKF